MQELTSPALLLQEPRWCMTCAMPFSEWMTFHFNPSLSLGPSGHFLSEEQISQLWQLFLLLSQIRASCCSPATWVALGEKQPQHSQTAFPTETSSPLCHIEQVCIFPAVPCTKISIFYPKIMKVYYISHTQAFDDDTDLLQLHHPYLNIPF